MNPLAHIPAIKIAGLHFQVCEVTPVLAAEWLKRNRRNRRVKEPTLDAYVRDMKNDAWYLTHQGIAFDDEGNLIDGQHRLEAIVRSKLNVRLFVSAGWPANGKAKTMDAVDRGANRSIADQLHLQHGMSPKDAGRVVQIANSIGAMASGGGSRVSKSSTACVLAVLELYADPIKYVLANPLTAHGLKSATVAGVVALGRAVWPEQTSDFLTRLKTGENLTRGNPILELRNWLMGAGTSEEAKVIRMAVCHHLHAFVEGRQLLTLVVTSNASLLHLLKLQGERVEKLRHLFGLEAKVFSENTSAAKSNGVARAAEAPPAKFNLSATGPDALRVGATLSAVFSTTDLAARVDNTNVVGLWLADWRRRGWIVPVGTREQSKTKEFGRV